MSEIAAPSGGRATQQEETAAVAEGRAAASAVGAVVLLAGVGAAFAWQAEAWFALGASLLLGLASLLLWGWLWRRLRAQGRTLGAFAEHLRSGDVAAALRALKADSPWAMSVWSVHSGAGLRTAASPPSPAAPSQPPSQFDQHARDVELALGDRERRWQARMRLSADWHWETDADLRISWVSQDLASLGKLGVQPGDLVGHRLHEVPLFDPPDSDAAGWKPVQDRMAQRRTLRDVVIEVRRRGLSPVWVALNARAHFDDMGEFTGYEGVGRDVTEARIAHLRLAESERRHAMMADLAADWYWQTDDEHRLIELGPVARQLVGTRVDQVLGRPRWEAFADGASDTEWAAHRADLDARRPFRGFEFAVRSTGSGGQGLRWVAVSGVPRTDAKQQFLGYHGVGRDITLKKRAEGLLLSRNEQLERLVAVRTAELEQTNRDLEAFARQLAHELRTPISQVVGLTDLLKSAAWVRLADDEREWLRLAGQSAREMSHTVTALLELARSTSTALLLEAVDLSALAESVVSELPWLERAAPVEWRIEPGLVAHCSAPLARVVLTNLLGNAAKFTRDVPAPQVALGRDASTEGAFVVQDNGAGFDAAQADALFQPFVRLHRQEQFHGTGLGLSIVRRVVERHGGSIRAEGQPGRGARFVFRFSAVRAQATAAADNDNSAAA
jgi:PAS domain S-box-containing protein